MHGNRFYYSTFQHINTFFLPNIYKKNTLPIAGSIVTLFSSAGQVIFFDSNWNETMIIL